jgi:hypothetical protein
MGINPKNSQAALISLVEIGERSKIDETIPAKDDELVRRFPFFRILVVASSCCRSALRATMPSSRESLEPSGPATSIVATGPEAAGASHASNFAPK